MHAYTGPELTLQDSCREPGCICGMYTKFTVLVRSDLMGHGGLG